MVVNLRYRLAVVLLFKLIHVLLEAHDCAPYLKHFRTSKHAYLGNQYYEVQEPQEKHQAIRVLSGFNL